MNKKKRISKNDIKTAKRLLKYVTETYKFRFVLVFICILISAVASISVSLSLKFMLDDYIIPLIGQQNPNYTELYQALGVLACIFIAGVLATFTYTRLMVYIGQGVLKRVRDDMFEHMQTLPIRYFDERTNGSIMSHRNFHFHACVKSDPDSSCICCDWNYDEGDRKNRWKQWKIFCETAEFTCGCNRICRRTDERTARCQSVQP